jgi:alginate O-acetyltransferase complex protein AlgI
MVFSSVTFLFYFLPAFLLLYYILPWKNTVLLCASLVFYAWGEPRFIPLLLSLTLLNYALGRAIARIGSRRTLLLGTGVTVNLAVLAYYKCAGLFASAFSLGPGQDLSSIALPLGMSFFVFQGISYLVDVYRGQVVPQSRLLTFAMYKTMFPQLIAGPIVRYQQIAGDIVSRDTPARRVWRGFGQFITGLAQKVLIANTVALAADRLFDAGAAHLSTAAAWLAVLCYAIQILFDFAGYSNMAIGIGQMIGFSFPANFNHPYSSGSVTEFWRRWHISLSTWFRDYVYIPLGGNRGAPWRTYANLSVVFLLCGLWHGVAWTFVIWGAWHGALLALERAWLGTLLARLPRVAGQAYMLLAVMLGWVFFRANDVPSALRMLNVMFTAHDGGAMAHPWQLDIGPPQWTALAAGCALSMWRPPQRWNRAASSSIYTALTAGATLVALILCGASLAGGTYNPFIYFRF